MKLFRRIAESSLLMLFTVFVSMAASDDTLLLTLKKEQLQMRYAVSAVEANCHDKKNPTYEHELSESRRSYESASKAQNAWIQNVHDSIVGRDLLSDSSKTLWLTASEAKKNFQWIFLIL